MPVFTVTVQGPSGQTKTVTVNTDDMSAEVVPNVGVPNASMFAPVESSNGTNPFLQPEVSPEGASQAFTNNDFVAAPVSQESPSSPEVASNLPHNFQKGVDPWATNAPNVESTSVRGGKRSTRIFRSKKTRRTRKLRR